MRLVGEVRLLRVSRVWRVALALTGVLMLITGATVGRARGAQGLGCLSYETRDDGYPVEWIVDLVTSEKQIDYRQYPEYPDGVWYNEIGRSPDGSYLYYPVLVPGQGNGKDHYTLFIKRRRGPNQILIQDDIASDGPNPSLSLVWSPDSRYFVYWYEDTASLSQTILANADGTNKRVIDEGHSILHGWSADSAYFAFTDTLGLPYPTSVTLKIWSVRENRLITYTPRTTKQSWNMAFWSEQGHWLAYRGFDKSDGWVSLISPERSDSIEFVDSGFEEHFLFWSPNGRYVAADGGPIRGVAIIGIDGTTAQLQYDLILPELNNWSLDGESYTFVRTRPTASSRPDLVTYHLPEKRLEMLISNVQDGWQKGRYTLVESADTQIKYTLLDLETLNRFVLDDVYGDVKYVDLSPSGEYVVIGSDAGLTWARINGDKLYSGNGPEAPLVSVPVWSTDGEMLVWYRDRLVITNVFNNTTQHVAVNPPKPKDDVWSLSIPENSHYVVSGPTYANGTTYYDVFDGVSVTQIPMPPTFISPAHESVWSPDVSMVAVRDTSFSPPTLEVVSTTDLKRIYFDGSPAGNIDLFKWTHCQ